MHSHEIASLAINETRDCQRERVKNLRPAPRFYEVGVKVFARRSVQFDKKKGRVDKAQYAHTGPWEVVRKLSGALYLRDCALSLPVKTCGQTARHGAIPRASGVDSVRTGRWTGQSVRATVPQFNQMTVLWIFVLCPNGFEPQKELSYLM